MSQIGFTPDDQLKIEASGKSSKDDFNFLTGHHKIHHKKLKSRLSQCTEWFEFEGSQEMRKLLTGIGNVDNYYMTTPHGKSIEGMALRLFNPDTKLWSIYWADSEQGKLEPPVVGSFENNMGHFFGKDVFQGRDILVQFKWDVTDPERPVWSQAFSADKGKTWEWNWYMYFSNDETGETTPTQKDSFEISEPVKVVELRNYLTKPGQRDKFIDFFEANFIDSQNALGGHILGRFTVKGQDDNFFWIRGFNDMAARSKFLPAFYRGDYWKQRRDATNAMLLNNDNVYLLKPLHFFEATRDAAIDSQEFYNKGRFFAIDFYIANNRLPELINFFKEKYLSFLKGIGINHITLWTSELQQNDYPSLPVFQDQNLLVTITIYKDEKEFTEKMKQLSREDNTGLRNQMLEIVTSKNTVLLYPTRKTYPGNQ